MRVIMIGDVVGEPGLAALEQRLPGLIERHAADITIVNGENAAGGFGLTAETLDRILAAGADMVTSGNHVWEKRDFWPVLDEAAKGGRPVLRPANYPPMAAPPGTSTPGASVPCAATPGTGWLRISKNSPRGPLSALVINLQGRERMTAIDCPFRCFDAILAEAAGLGPAEGAPFIMVDFHAESAEEKESLGYYLDGRASIVAGTHTHVQTADERILPGGTAYITDLGMTGAMSGIIGMDKRICLDRARTQIQFHMECAPPESETDYVVTGIVVELDGQGKALSIERVRQPTGLSHQPNLDPLRPFA